MRFTILTTVYNEYELLRQLIESILVNVDGSTYAEIIIVDDYSFTDVKLREYENYLTDTYDKIKVINFDESRPSVYTAEQGYNRDNTNFSLYDSTKNLNDSDIDPTKHFNFGPVYAIQKGLEEVKTEFVLVVDTDIIFLKNCKTVLNDIAKEFDKNKKVMSLGQVVGLNSNEKEVCKNQVESKTSTRLRGGLSGGVSPMANACRMDAWNKHNLEKFTKGPTILGWSNSLFLNDIFDKGFYTSNYPLFSFPYLVHLGAGTVSSQLPGRKDNGCSFGFCKTIKQKKYGGRVGVDNIIDWYSGRYIIDIDPIEYRSLLEEKYNSEFSTIIPFDEDILIKGD